jgi:tRNA modification GTPase
MNMNTRIRLAGPGEFTRRAYENGRIGAHQAEAVLKILQAEDEEARREAVGLWHERGHERLLSFRRRVLDLLARIEGSIDFLEEGLDLLCRQAVEEEIQKLMEDPLLSNPSRPPASSERWLPEVYLCGPANAGKSTLFNRWTGGRHIVSDRPGTTRDSLDAEIEWNGVRFRLVDTPGTLPPEKEGAIDRTGRSVLDKRISQGQPLVLWVEDLTESHRQGAFHPSHNANLIKVGNKLDAAPSLAPDGQEEIWVSAKKGTGLADLEGLILNAIQKSSEVPNQVLTSAREAEAARTTRLVLRRVKGEIREPLQLELVAAGLREILSHLEGCLDGVEIDEAVLDRVFAQFCIGK